MLIKAISNNITSLQPNINPKQLEIAKLIVLQCLLGNAIGAQLSYMIKRDITPEIVEKAMNLEGGGISKMLPGQLVQDGEMTICLVNALSQHPQILDISLIQKYFV